MGGYFVEVKKNGNEDPHCRVRVLKTVVLGPGDVLVTERTLLGVGTTETPVSGPGVSSRVGVSTFGG